MTTLEYITKDINLSHEQFEAIGKLAEICGMTSMFEAPMNLREIQKAMQAKKAAEEAERAKLDVKTSARPAHVPSFSDDDDTVFGTDEMFGMNTDLSGGITDDNADVGEKAVDYDFTNPERVVDDKFKNETKLQKDTRELFHSICDLAGIDFDQATEYGDVASDAVDPNASTNDLAIEKVKAFLAAMPVVNKQNVYGDEITDLIENYGNEHPDSPLLGCIADFFDGVVDAHQKLDDKTKKVLDDDLIAAFGFDPKQTKVASSSDIRKMQKQNAIGRIRSRGALSNASVGFVNPADETKRQAALDQLARQGHIH